MAVADPEGVRGSSIEPPLVSKLFHFHGVFLDNMYKMVKLNPL